MKLELLLMSFLLPGTLLLAEPISWKTSGSVVREGDNMVLAAKPGKQASVFTKTTFKSGSFQNFSMMTQAEQPSEITVQTAGFTDPAYNKFFRLPIPSGDSKISFGFYVPEETEMKLVIQLEGKDAPSKVRVLSPAFSSGRRNPPEFYLTLRAGGLLRTVSAEDHIEGGTATEFTPFTQGSSMLRSLDFCMMPGKTYVLKFWAKGDMPGPLTARADGWAPKRKHFYVQKTFQVSTEYREFRIEVKTPEDVDAYLGVMRLQLTPGLSKKLFVKDLTIEERASR